MGQFTHSATPGDNSKISEVSIYEALDAQWELFLDLNAVHSALGHRHQIVNPELSGVG